MSRIGIIDYGMGNLGSVTNACRFLGLSAELVDAPDAMDGYDALILPGVGGFGDCMSHLKEHGYVEPVRQWIQQDRPFLGICLGLQILFEGSEEAPETKGLGLLPGRIIRFPVKPGYKVPQIAWNQVRQRKPACPLFEGIPDQSYFYFVHSYYAAGANEEHAAGITDYGVPYVSAVWAGNLMAVQFHPEKSQQLGLRLLGNFAGWLDRSE